MLHFKKIKFSFILSLFLFPFNNADAQLNIRDTEIAFPMIGVTAGIQMPGGDMAKRFGNNFNVGAVFQWKLKTNWIFGIEGDFIFSDNVKENNFLDKFKTLDGNIINSNGEYAIVALTQRGFKTHVKAGKIFPVMGPNKNSGLMTTIGIGYLQHRIRIETPGSNIPFLTGDYAKGYDRLSSGLSLTEFIGYMNFSNSRLVNFYAGLEFTQAFTKNRRELNFDTGLKDNSNRLDLLFGIRIGWVFPIYKRIAEKTYFN